MFLAPAPKSVWMTRYNQDTMNQSHDANTDASYDPDLNTPRPTSTGNKHTVARIKYFSIKHGKGSE